MKTASGNPIRCETDLKVVTLEHATRPWQFLDEPPSICADL